MGGTVTRDFFDRPSQQVAPDLLGCLLTCNGVSVLLTETEAYAGEVDPASHAYRGRTPRNAVMFGPPGHAYVYFTYGMHFCVNLVCMPAGTASAVLLRAGEVVAGESVAAARRGPAVRLRDLARGPARLCQALGIDRSWNGTDACDPSSGLRLAPPSPGEASRGPVHSGPRVGVREGAEVPWRFWLDGDPSVSVYRPHVPRVRTSRKRLPVERAGVAQCLL